VLPYSSGTVALTVVHCPAGIELGALVLPDAVPGVVHMYMLPV